ncbi:MAG: TonB-dependent receptor, partial [Gemmatimonadetes bacterium]|nr:TonB-dependent receptor [Gemmatimonadota bacterium]
MRYVIRACTLLLIGGREAVAQSPRDTFQLSEIVVTATRVPTSRASVASTVTVIPGEVLRAQGVRYVADALRLVPGAAVAQNGSFGAVTSLFLRGGESDYVKVLVDGVPLNAAGGAIDLGGLTADNVDRIEIVAGPTSVLYGSDAVAGVVQIFTRRGRGPGAVETGFRAGTYGSRMLEAALSGGRDDLDYSFSASRFTTDGSYAFNNGARNAVASGRVHLAPDARTDGTLTLRYQDNVFHFPTDGAGRLVDQNQFTYEHGTTIALEAGRLFTDRLEARLQLTSHQRDGGADDRKDGAADTLGFYAFQSLNRGERRSADLLANWHAGNRGVVTLGGRLELEQERGFNASQSQFGPSSGQSDFSRTNRAYYAQALLEPRRGLSLTAGSRLDDNGSFGAFATYRVGASYRLAGTRIRGSLGSGFKEPTFFENFATGFVTGNPALKPE